MISLNEASIQLLIKNYNDDKEAIMLIQDCLLSFSKYHAAIYRMETYMKLFGYNNTDKEDYQQEVIALDKDRTASHNRVISSISILNRLCEKNDIPLIYNGVISVEKPYRREIADACLDYISIILQKRQ